MKKSELKIMVQDMIEESLENFFEKDLGDILEVVINKKLKTLLKEKLKKPLKDRIIEKANKEASEDDGDFNSLLEELAFGERGDKIADGVARLNNSINRRKAGDILDESGILASVGKDITELTGKEDVNTLAQADYDDSILGIE